MYSVQRDLIFSSRVLRRVIQLFVSTPLPKYSPQLLLLYLHVEFLLRLSPNQILSIDTAGMYQQDHITRSRQHCNELPLAPFVSD